jgi:hypothetical protein
MIKKNGIFHLELNRVALTRLPAGHRKYSNELFVMQAPQESQGTYDVLQDRFSRWAARAHPELVSSGDSLQVSEYFILGLNEGPEV